MVAATPPRGLRERMQRLARPRAPEPLPAHFDRHRVYVLPTAFGGFFFVLLLTMCIGALNYNNNPALLLCLLLAGAALASLLYAHLQLSGLTVQAVGADPVPAGKPLALRLHVRADPRRPRHGLEVRAGDVAAPLHLHEGAGEATLAVPTTRRGPLWPGRLRIATTRPLGLARAWGWVWPDTPLLVYPAPEAHGPGLPLGVGDNAQPRLHPAGDDVHHLRTWRRGDQRRAIAWKATARRGQLLVREYEQPHGADVVLGWDATGDLGHEDRIRRLARWVDDAEREQRRYLLRLPARPDLGPGRGSAHRHACLRALALLPERGHG